MSLTRITDRREIREVLDAYMLRLGERRAPHISVICAKRGSVWNGRVQKAPHLIDHSRPISASDEADGDRVYTLTNRDSGYTSAVGDVKLSEIEYVEAEQ